MKEPTRDRIAALEARLAALERRLDGGVLAVDDEAFEPFERVQSVDPVDVAALVLLDRAGAARLALHVGRGGTAGVATVGNRSISNPAQESRPEGGR